MAVFGSKAIAGYGTIHIGKCAECKQPFSYTKYHKYVRKDGGTKIYCSWHCFRVKAAEYEAKEREAFLKECLKDQRREERRAEFMRRKRSEGYKPDDVPVFVDLQEAQEYLEHTRERIKHYSKELMNAEPRSGDRDRARKSLNRWERKLKNVQKTIEELKKQEEEQNVQEADV